MDNKWQENQIRLWALERKNWLLTGSLRNGEQSDIGRGWWKVGV
ncbi:MULTISPECIES: hypothetical protein [unclassified Pseudomonas]